MNIYTLVLDIWEGQLDIDEAALFAGGVSGLVIRLNQISGGHHIDKGFTKQWAEAEAFVRWPYFVYNPWVTGMKNYDWLAANMPRYCPAVAIDVEVYKSGYSATEYGAQLTYFMQLVQQTWKAQIYTGEWFLTEVSPWPKADIWWAQYPYAMYPTNRITIGWDELRMKIIALKWPPINAKKAPGPVQMWQCSGDRIILPGSSRAMDINLFPGTVADLKTWLGYDDTPVVHPPAQLTLEERVANLERAVRGAGWIV
jgi:GH25 family lysozyme M1 (1,4-beta-N-acetylmuramidase)